MEEGMYCQMKAKENFPDFLPAEVVGYLKLEGPGTIIQGFVDKINRHGLPNSRYLILTDYELFLYEKVKFHNEVVEKTRITYFDIKKLEIINNLNIIISFGEPQEMDDQEKFILNLKGELIQHVFLKLYKTFEAGFLPNEKPEYIFPPEYPIPGVERNIPEARMKIFLRKQGKKLDEKSISDMNKFFYPKDHRINDTFKLNQIPSIVEYLPLFLSTFVFVPKVTKIIVPCTLELSLHDSLFSVLGDFIKTNPNITSFTFLGKIPSDFNKFVDGYVANQNNSVQELIFQKCDFKETHMSDFARLIDHKPITRLTLISSVDENVALNFFKIFSHPGFQNITYLNIDHSYGVDIVDLMPNLENVEDFSARMCGINLYDFFLHFSKLSNPKMNSIQLGGNLNIDLVQSNVIIPPVVRSLQLDDIAWDPNSLINIFSQCITLGQESNGFAINLSNAKMSNEKWDIFFRAIEGKASNTLEKLFWNENPINLTFFRFLFNSPNLKNVSLSGCFSDSSADKENRQLLKEFIKKSKNIIYLHLDGTRRKSLGKKGLNTVFKALSENDHIRLISVRDNHGGNSTLDFLSTCLGTNHVLEYAAIDGNDISSLSSYIDFFEKTRMRCKEFAITWPEKETRDMIQFGEVTEEDVQYAKLLYTKMRKGDNSKVKKRGNNK